MTDDGHEVMNGEFSEMVKRNSLSEPGRAIVMDATL